MAFQHVELARKVDFKALGIKPSFKPVLLVIGHHINIETKRWKLSKAQIAFESGCSERHVYSAIKALEAYGFIAEHAAKVKNQKSTYEWLYRPASGSEQNESFSRTSCRTIQHDIPNSPEPHAEHIRDIGNTQEKSVPLPFLSKALLSDGSEFQLGEVEWRALTKEFPADFIVETWSRFCNWQTRNPDRRKSRTDVMLIFRNWLQKDAASFKEKSTRILPQIKDFGSYF